MKMYNHRLTSKILLTFIVVCFMLAGCSSKQESPTYDIFTGMNQSIKSETIRTLDDVILAADYIVLGKLTNIESFKTGEILYSIQIEKQLKGHN